MSDALIIMKRKWAAFLVMHHLIIKKEKEKKIKKMRRYWIKHLYQNRKQLDGNTLVNLFSLDESTGHFKNFLRMSPNDFDFLINKIGPKIAKMDTKLRKAIPVKEKLAITLRFLATGDSYASLQYLFKISKQSISVLVPEVCSALIDELKDYVKVSNKI